MNNATAGDEVCIWVPCKFARFRPYRTTGLLFLGTKYDGADVSTQFVVDMGEIDVCALEDVRTTFYLGKMKSEGAVVKVCDENKTVQVELLQQIYVLLNMQCTFTYNGQKYVGKVTKIVK